MSGVFDGLRVIDASHAAPRPMAARFLADWGADVIHVEHPVRGDLMRGFQQGSARSISQPSRVRYAWELFTATRGA